MPNIKSAIKRDAISKARRLRNLSNKSRLNTARKTFLAAIEGADAEAWEEYVATGGDQRFEYGYINDAGTWVHKPQYGDTLIRTSEQ